MPLSSVPIHDDGAVVLVGQQRFARMNYSWEMPEGGAPLDEDPFDGVRRVMESYVLDRTDLDLYGERVAVDFVGHVRPTLRFDSIDELLVAMARDVERTRDLLER